MTANEFRHCHSCAAPLDNPDFSGPVDDYCKHCVDDSGAVISREQARAGIAKWMQAWQPAVDAAELECRVDDYMNAMPHWAAN